MKFDNILIEAVNKTNQYISLFMNLEENPEWILTELFSGESDNLLTRIIESSHELTGQFAEVHDLQDELYKILIPYLQTLIKGMDLVYDAERYPAPIQIFEGEREIGRVNIYEKTFTVIPHEDLRQELKHLRELEKEYNQNSEEIAKFEGYQSNPMEYGDTTMKKINIMFRQNHFNKEIKEKYQGLIEYSMELEQNIISQKLRVERTQEGVLPYEEMQYDIANIFRDKYKYEVKRQEDES